MPSTSNHFDLGPIRIDNTITSYDADQVNPLRHHTYWTFAGLEMQRVLKKFPRKPKTSMPSKNGLRFRLLSPDTSPNLGPRRGRLEVPEHFSIDTPNFLGNTSRGVIPHLTLDLLQGYLKVEGAHFALEDCGSRPSL